MESSDTIDNVKAKTSQRDDGHQVKRQRPNRILPPGWLDYPPSGQEINGLIASKIPLGELFNDSIPPGKRYSMRQVIPQQRVEGRKIGLVIDLTNSSGYYDVNEWPKQGIQHVKIACKGRDSVPDNDAVDKFLYEVARFLARPKLRVKQHILVHCTDGHNCTGYMIIHYLMRTMPISVTQAISIFSYARPPGIYKPDYIDALYNFYDEKKPDMVVCPATPKWNVMPDDDMMTSTMETLQLR